MCHHNYKVVFDVSAIQQGSFYLSMTTIKTRYGIQPRSGVR